MMLVFFFIFASLCWCWKVFLLGWCSLEFFHSSSSVRVCECVLHFSSSLSTSSSIIIIITIIITLSSTHYLSLSPNTFYINILWPTAFTRRFELVWHHSSPELNDVMTVDGAHRESLMWNNKFSAIQYANCSPFRFSFCSSIQGDDGTDIVTSFYLWV